MVYVCCFVFSAVYPFRTAPIFLFGWDTLLGRGVWFCFLVRFVFIAVATA